jgi:hypothetical protein
MRHCQHAKCSLEGAKSSVRGMVTSKPNMSFYVTRYSRKERRVEWKEEKISIGKKGEPDGFVEVSDMARNSGEERQLQFVGVGSLMRDDDCF